MKKSCSNCKYADLEPWQAPCVSCTGKGKHDNWEPKVKDVH